MNISYFAHKDFMQFLQNVETKVHPMLPVMRRIDAVNFDIVNYLDSKDVLLTMSIYFINAPKGNTLMQQLSGGVAS